ncbi:MAG: hypothetical protein U0269_13810 [Polyangiales bacterium]
MDLPRLRDEYERHRARARALAGRPGDIAQRVMIHHQIYRDSGANHVFPLVALHGALWGCGFFESTGKLGELVSYRYFYDEAQRLDRHAMLDRFAEGFKAINREVFIDTYANFYFTREHGEAPRADELVHPELLALLNAAHRARRSGAQLDPATRRALFSSALRFEQERTVAPGIAAEIARFDCPILRALCLKPVVRFAYFPAWRAFYFSDFSDKDERVRRAMKSYQIAEEQGLDRVEASIEQYRVLPDAYFADPDRVRSELYRSLAVDAT